MVVRPIDEWALHPFVLFPSSCPWQAVSCFLISLVSVSNNPNYDISLTDITSITKKKQCRATVVSDVHIDGTGARLTLCSKL